MAGFKIKGKKMSETLKQQIQLADKLRESIYYTTLIYSIKLKVKKIKLENETNQ